MFVMQISCAFEFGFMISCTEDTKDIALTRNF